MKRATTRAILLVGATAVGTMVLAAAAPDSGLFFHERKEVAGLAVVFGAEPEPALTDEMQFLRWRVSSLETEEAYSDFSEPTVMVLYDGQEFGPFTVRPVRGTPGQYQTRHIFTEAGEYESVLSFRKGEESEVHMVDFTFRIGDRAQMEIPPRRRGGS